MIKAEKNKVEMAGSFETISAEFVAIQRAFIVRVSQEEIDDSAREAEDELGVMRLASRICDLRKAGYKIRKENAKGRNRYGKKTTFARYSLIKEEEKK